MRAGGPIARGASPPARGLKAQNSSEVNLPNILTLSRLAVLPLLIVLLQVQFAHHYQIAAAVFALAALTDTVDGNLARSSGQVTELGKFLDPLADKLFVVSVLIVLVAQGQIAASIVIVIFARELLITVLRSLSADQGHTISASSWGKAKTVAQIIAALLLILQQPYPGLRPAADVLVAVSLVFTVWSGADYLWRFRGVWLAARPAILGDDAMVELLAQRLGEQLRSRGLTVAVAESCTGGMLGGAITAVPGSSQWFRGGVIAYSDAVKSGQIRVPERLLATYGAVSEEVATAMAEGVRAELKTDFALSITGIAGPTADGSRKPVGLTYIGLAEENQAMADRHDFGLDRDGNRRQAVRSALELLEARLNREA